MSFFQFLSHRICARNFSGLSESATTALQSIKQSLSKPLKPTQLSKKEKNNIQGNFNRYVRKGDNEEFWGARKNQHNRMFEPTDTFELVVTTSKNNVWIAAVNKGRQYRTVFQTHAGNVKYSKSKQRTPEAAYRIAENASRKLRRLGVTCASVKFRRLMRVDQCLQAFHATGLRVTKLTHNPRLPYGTKNKPRNKRRV